MGFEVNGNSGNQPNWLDWQNYCAGMNNVLPFLGNILFNNPMPWVQNYFQQQWFPGASSGLLTADQFQYNYAPTGPAGPSNKHAPESTREEDPANDADLTPEELLRQNREKALKKAEISKLVENHRKMYELLKSYGESLTDDTEKTFFMETLKSYENKAKESMSKENLEIAVANIKVMYDEYAKNIWKYEEAEAEKGITSASDPEYVQKAKNLQSAIANGNDATFGVLTGENPKSWDNDVDILELLSAWNGDDGFSEYHLARVILNKYKEATGENKPKLEALMSKLQGKLVSVAEDIDETKLTDETKNLLTGAIAQLNGFDNIEKQAHNIDNYNKSFDNLYRAIRLAKAEIADNELKEKFEFLGDNNPCKNPTFLPKTKKDLSDEGLPGNNDDVSAAPASLSVKEQIQARTQHAVATLNLKKENTSYTFYIYIENNSIVKYDADGNKVEDTINDYLDVKNVSLEMKRNGNYKLSLDNKESWLYYDLNGKKIESSSY